MATIVFGVVMLHLFVGVIYLMHKLSPKKDIK
jgi:hypothetical protein